MDNSRGRSRLASISTKKGLESKTGLVVARVPLGLKPVNLPPVSLRSAERPDAAPSALRLAAASSSPADWLRSHRSAAAWRAAPHV